MQTLRVIRTPAAIVAQHIDGAIHLDMWRRFGIAGANVGLHHLRRFDDRLAAHLDGLSIADENGWSLVEAALETPNPGSIFVATVLAIEGRDKHPDRLDRLFALLQVEQDAQSGLHSAFGWLEPPTLQGIVAQLLASADPSKRLAGIAASAIHRVDPGLIAARRFDDTYAGARARTYRAAGELGKRELVARLAVLADEDESCQFWAAWSAVLLGDRESALKFLKSSASADRPFKSRAFQLALLATPPDASRDFLRQFATDPTHVRTLIRGAGFAGDPSYIPWLIGHMSDDKLARIAGESFSMITGLDLAWLDLERKPPESFESGPNDDPEDANVAMDEDDGLPWPDQTLIQQWWSQNGARFTQGERHFMGEPVSRESCVRVLKEGFQRQRIAAALHRSLLAPGTPLFEWRAPAWRQQRELAVM